MIPPDPLTRQGLVNSAPPTALIMIENVAIIPHIVSQIREEHDNGEEDSSNSIQPLQSFHPNQQLHCCNMFAALVDYSEGEEESLRDQQNEDKSSTHSWEEASIREFKDDSDGGPCQVIPNNIPHPTNDWIFVPI